MWNDGKNLSPLFLVWMHCFHPMCNFILLFVFGFKRFLQAAFFRTRVFPSSLYVSLYKSMSSALRAQNKSICTAYVYHHNCGCEEFHRNANIFVELTLLILVFECCQFRNCWGPGISLGGSQYKDVVLPKYGSDSHNKDKTATLQQRSCWWNSGESYPET